ncbi:hypothetical protein THASP1DRAFT_34817 [Thamnocephalis sphaerospora]|uniref:GDT1 family protein n=1 Tax=Thamnocephalis sphaerospora TaxID=78915 RepID=A0A4P9XPK9_9FUNG|nr:hypothetical protein THASP1DRAFT_34817 [Thamnocephalis sphaerospora]|eukprot:RKP07812.1 hypothetical protein THASP1DRAFT_34817 [Thamnocephalis sphaerospora]
MDHLTNLSCTDPTEYHTTKEAGTPLRAFALSFLMILGSEVGDKTFLIAAVLAMRQSRVRIFVAAMAAMVVMSVLSAELGHLLPNLLPRRLVDLLAAALFVVFGLLMLREGWKMSVDEQYKELEEVRAELEEKEWRENGGGKQAFEMEVGASNNDSHDAEDQYPRTRPGTFGSRLRAMGRRIHGILRTLLSPVFLQTFVLVFLAEWGDRSQFATIALAAAQDVTWTTIGTIAGHAVCTGLAVIGGRLLAQRISVRTVTLAGAVLFELFGLIYLYAFLTESAAVSESTP